MNADTGALSFIVPLIVLVPIVRRQAEREARHGGGEGILSIRQSRDRRHPRACVTTDGHPDSYPRAIRTELDEGVKHRTNQYLNNRIEQDHRGIKGTIRTDARLQKS